MTMRRTCGESDGAATALQGVVWKLRPHESPLGGSERRPSPKSVPGDGKGRSRCRTGRVGNAPPRSGQSVRPNCGGRRGPW